MNKVKSIIKNLGFSIKLVYLSSRSSFIISFVLTLINQVSIFATMYITKAIIDSLQAIYLGREKFNDIVSLIILLVSINLLMLLINRINSVIKRKQHYLFDCYIENIFIKKNAELDISFFDNPTYYNCLEEAQRSKQALGFVIYRVIHFFSYIVSLCISLILTFSYREWYLTFVVIAFTFPALFNKGKYYSSLYKYDAETRQLSRKTSYLAGILLGQNAAKEVRFYDLKDYLLNKYSSNVDEYIKGKKRIISSLGLKDSIFNVIPMIGVLLSMFFVTKNIFLNVGQLGDFVYYLGIYTSLKDNMLGIIGDLAKLQESDHAITSFIKFFDLKPFVNNDGQILLDKIESVEFENVKFCYPNTDKYVLENVSFKFHPPEKVAIVGLNGEGKTTIVKLLLRFYDVTEGKILINKLDIKMYDIQSLRSLISPCFQDSTVYSMSLRLNVALSALEHKDDDSRVIEAMKTVGLGDFIDKLDTEITRDFDENGLMLSGGQKQRLTLARLAFSMADLYILDEPTASLDPIAEQKIMDSFRKIYHNKGMILISHRLSNITTTDNIFVLKNGVIVESGPHEELCKKQGLYYEMFMQQRSNYYSVNEGQT